MTHKAIKYIKPSFVRSRVTKHPALLLEDDGSHIAFIPMSTSRYRGHHQLMSFVENPERSFWERKICDGRSSDIEKRFPDWYLSDLDKEFINEFLDSSGSGFHLI